MLGVLKTFAGADLDVASELNKRPEALSKVLGRLEFGEVADLDVLKLRQGERAIAIDRIHTKLSARA